MTNNEQPPRAALYVDFDNVFMALLRWDERAAYAFGERPDAWLAWLEGRAQGGPPASRRTLVRRCYLNPGGYYDFQHGRPVARYRAARDQRNRAYFSEFRGNFVQAGFDVVDCPPVAWLKNSADMKMALDIREALDHRTRFEEFVLLSGDSDFLPALARLRAFDRRITILAQDTAKPAYLAAADLVVGLDEFAHASLGNLPVAQVVATRPEPPPSPSQAPAPPQAPSPAPDSARPDLPALRAQALDWVREALARSPAGRLRLTDIGQSLPRAFPTLKQTDYAGAGSLGALIEEARDPGLSLSGPPTRRWVFDAERGEAPAEEAPAEALAMPAAPAAEPSAEPPAAEATPAEAMPAGIAEMLRDLLWGSRDPKGLPHDLPAYTPEELAFLLHAIAEALPLDPATAPAALVEAAAARGLRVSTREVAALLRWLMRGYVKLNEPATAEGAPRLARVLFATLVNTLRARGEKLSEAETEALRAWSQSTPAD